MHTLCPKKVAHEALCQFSLDCGVMLNDSLIANYLDSVPGKKYKNPLPTDRAINKSLV